MLTPSGGSAPPVVDAVAAALFQELPLGLCHLAPGGRIISANPAFVRMVGPTCPPPLAGRPLVEVVPTDFLTTVANADGQGPRTARWQTNDGRQVVTETTVISLQPEGTILAVTDHTDRHLLEQNRRQAGELESLATLAGGIAHDFNNLLAIIMGHASLLTEVTADPARVVRIADVVLDAGRRAAGIVKQLMLFAGHSSSERVPTDLHQLIRQSIARTRWPETVTVLQELSGPETCTVVDPSQIDHCLDQLFANAVDAMPSGGTITVSTAVTHRLAAGRADPAEPYFRIAVADTGHGMDRSTLAHIFDPFFVGDRNQHGRGLGLPVVYGILRSHHGFVEVESSPGNGSRVHLFLPLKLAPPRGTGAGAERAAPPPATAPSGNADRRTVLLVEDEEYIGSLMAEALQRQGIAVLLARSAEEALNLFQTHRAAVGVVFTDVGLPGLDGYALCEQLRAMEPRLPLLIASGFLKCGTHPQPFPGDVTYLQKPYDRNEVVLRIHRALSLWTQ